MLVTFYYGDNWVDIFFDSTKVYGGHSIRPRYLLDLVAKYMRHLPLGINTLTIEEVYLSDDDYAMYPVAMGLGESKYTEV